MRRWFPKRRVLKQYVDLTIDSSDAGDKELAGGIVEAKVHEMEADNVDNGDQHEPQAETDEQTSQDSQDGGDLPEMLASS